MKANKTYNREAARQAYLERVKHFASLQAILEKNFSQAETEEELLAMDGRAIQAHIATNRAA